MARLLCHGTVEETTGPRRIRAATAAAERGTARERESSGRERERRVRVWLGRVDHRPEPGFGWAQPS